MAADIAGGVGDALAELGVIVIPHLESIESEPLPTSKERIVRVVMDYTLVDSQTGERETIRVAGEGRDPGDKGPYKAMTGALKYALLQTFLIATGDDPENERSERAESVGAPQPATIGPEKAGQLSELLAETGTEVERVLEYFKVSRLEDLTESAHRKALQILSRKRARSAAKEPHHAQG
jgi:G3E family GTPase